MTVYEDTTFRPFTLCIPFIFGSLFIGLGSFGIVLKHYIYPQPVYSKWNEMNWNGSVPVPDMKRHTHCNGESIQIAVWLHVPKCSIHHLLLMSYGLVGTSSNFNFSLFFYAPTDSEFDVEYGLWLFIFCRFVPLPPSNSFFVVDSPASHFLYCSMVRMSGFGEGAFNSWVYLFNEALLLILLCNNVHSMLHDTFCLCL